MSYLEHITNYLVSLTGKGVVVSSSDLDVMRRWEAAGVPAEAACRAIRRLWTRDPRRPCRLVLADCDLPLADPELPTTTSLRTRRDWSTATLLDRLVAVGRAEPDETLKNVYRALFKHVRALPDVALDLERVARLDVLAIAALERELPSLERRDARRRARQRARGLAGRDASREAAERLACVFLEEDYCERLGLRVPSDLLLHRDDDGPQKVVPGLRE